MHERARPASGRSSVAPKIGQQFDDSAGRCLFQTPLLTSRVTLPLIRLFLLVAARGALRRARQACSGWWRAVGDSCWRLRLSKRAGNGCCASAAATSSCRGEGRRKTRRAKNGSQDLPPPTGTRLWRVPAPLPLPRPPLPRTTPQHARLQRRSRLLGQPRQQAAPARQQGGRSPTQPCPRPHQPLLLLRPLLPLQPFPPPPQQLAAQAWAAGLHPPRPPSAAWEAAWAVEAAPPRALWALPHLQLQGPVQLLALLLTQPLGQLLAPLLRLPLPRPPLRLPLPLHRTPPLPRRLGRR